MANFNVIVPDEIIVTGTSSDKNITGPLASLDLNKYQSSETLTYPLDIELYNHWIKFNINLPERSKYSKELGGIDEGGMSQVQANRLNTPTQLNSSIDPISGAAGFAAGGAIETIKAGLSLINGEFNPASGDIVSKTVGGLVKGGLSAGATGVVLSYVDVTRKTKRLLQSILLYVPDTVQQTTAHTYDATSLTSALGMAGFAAEGAGAVGTSISNAFKSNTDLNVSGSGRANPMVAEALGKAAEATGNFGEGIGDVMLFSAGLALNPRIEILYKATANREFQFDFKFTPKSQKESEMVLNIIKAFKFHAAPELAEVSGTSGRYLVPPSEFDIEFVFNGEQNKALHKISTCVLEGIDVNYVTAGQFATFSDGMPIEIAMQLRFREVEIIHKNLVEQGF